MTKVDLRVFKNRYSLETRYFRYQLRYTKGTALDQVRIRAKQSADPSQQMCWYLSLRKDSC